MSDVLGAPSEHSGTVFIAIRDLSHAKGRFALLAGVIAMMTLMVVLLTGLTAGLGAAGVSAVQALPTTHVAIAEGTDFALSSLPASKVDELAALPGVRSAAPLGVTTTRLTAGGQTTAVTVFGTTTHAVTVPDTLDIGRGSAIDLGGMTLSVDAVAAETSFSHLPVVHVPLDVWHRVARTDAITAVVLDADRPVVAAGVDVLTIEQSFAAVSGYPEEQGSLTMIRVLLFVVSALVVGAFFTVWTMQRATDLAVVRAIGASRTYLLRDALGQAALVLAAGTAVGAAIAACLGLLAARAVPFVVDAETVLVPLGVMVAVGLAGATLAVRRVTTVDPLTALGSAR